VTGAAPPPRLADGWPGVAGIAVLLGGLFALHQTPAMTPAGGYLGGEFMYADPRGPELSVPTEGGRTVADAADVAFREIGEAAFDDAYWATIVATFADEADARSAAGTINPPEGAIASQHGPLLIVTPVEHDPEAPADPLVAELSALGGSVLVEGDRYGEGSIVVDLSCTAESDAAAAALSAAIGDYGSLPYYALARPPWVDPPITANEALARSTYARWSTSMVDSLAADGTLSEYADRFLEATSPEERERLTDDIGEYIAGRQLEGLDGEVHPGVVALLAARPTGGEADDTVAWGRELGRFMGQMRPVPDEDPDWFEQRVNASIGAAQAVGPTLQLGWISFSRIALGLPALLGYLGEEGCGEVIVRLTDFDDVRGD
jgi:hypothetical protein